MTYNKHNKGFTLMETMVAITILLVAVVGPMKLMGDSLAQIYTARDQILALSLAQEGIEAVRQVRDSNMLARWEQMRSEPTTTPTKGIWDNLSRGNYLISVDDGNVKVSSCSSCDLNNPAPIKTDDTGFYTQSGFGTPSRFSRVVVIEDIGSAPIFEKKVTSKVSWKTSGNQNKEVVITESMFAVNE